MKLEEILLAGAIGYLAFRFLDKRRLMSNKGSLEVVPADNGSGFASADGITSRNANVSCQIEPPQMISTALLPAENQPFADSDFQGLTPEKLENVNFVNSAWALGRDTVQNTMRNASHDLRSEPQNPTTLDLENNSWNNTTIGAQAAVREFDISVASGAYDVDSAESTSLRNAGTM